MSDSVQPHRWQPTRLPRPWDSPGKNTGVGCHFLLQCMKVKSQSESVLYSIPFPLVFKFYNLSDGTPQKSHLLIGNKSCGKQTEELWGKSVVVYLSY